MALILFDFDGVLADTLDDLLHFGQMACDQLGVRHVVKKEDLSNLEAMSFATFGQACEVPEPLLDRFVEICLKCFAEKKSPPAIFNGLADIVRRFSLNHKIAIVTTNSSQNVHAFLVEHHLEDCIHAIFGVDLPGSKAHKISLARNQFSVDANPDSVYMIGDSLSDMRAAKEASAKGIAVTWGHQSLEHLLRGEPDHVAYSPNDLIDIIEK